VRALVVTPNVADHLDGKKINSGFPDAAAETIVARYLAGHLMTVSRKSAADVELERLENVDEMWSLCFRRPRPGWRLLGRFLERDLFIGLRIYDRNVLGNIPNYTKLATDTIGDWKEKFGAIEPIRSTDLADYLSGVYRDADQP
jgi:hypothetical protein